MVKLKDFLEVSEPKTPKEKNIALNSISEPQEIFIGKNIDKIEKQAQKPEKAMFLKNLESVLETSGYKVIIELNEKTPTRIKSGILQANKIKGYNRMVNAELDTEISKLITNNILKTLKGAE